MAKNPYEQARSTGLYEKPAGLRGKYDNVRRFWEDEVTCLFLKPHLQQAFQIAANAGRGVRILDLGCGSGDGYELITPVSDRKAGFSVRDNRILPENGIETYLGIDINPGLLEQGKAVFKRNERVRFQEGSFAGGLPLEEGEKPFDIYLSTYGTFSHCTDDIAVKLIADIADHANPGAIVVADWLGWHAYEWQNLWTGTLVEDQVMHYIISYLVEPGEREGVQFEPFELRLMNKETIYSIVARACEQSNKKLRILDIFDRSVFVGRHMETGDYFPRPQPLRRVMNSLLETNRRTNLEKACVDYLPREGFKETNIYFENLARCWNSLVHYVSDLLNGKDVFPPSGPPVLQRAAGTMQQLIKASATLDLEDARANIIEPQLAFQLKSLEVQLQQGEGRAHGIVAVLQVE